MYEHPVHCGSLTPPSLDLLPYACAYLQLLSTDVSCSCHCYTVVERECVYLSRCKSKYAIARTQKENASMYVLPV